MLVYPMSIPTPTSMHHAQATHRQFRYGNVLLPSQGTLVAVLGLHEGEGTGAMTSTLRTYYLVSHFALTFLACGAARGALETAGAPPQGPSHSSGARTLAPTIPRRPHTDAGSAGAFARSVCIVTARICSKWTRVLTCSEAACCAGWGLAQLFPGVDARATGKTQQGLRPFPLTATVFLLVDVWNTQHRRHSQRQC